MSFNPNFFNGPRTNYTFHGQYQTIYNIPPPPPNLTSSLQNTCISDADILKKFETKAVNLKPLKSKPNVSINALREKLKDLLVTLNKIKSLEECLTENVTTLTDAEWNKISEEINYHKASLDKLRENVNNTQLDLLRKIIAKRQAKRMRLKRQKLEKKIEKEKMKLISRQIDENLKQIKDDIDKAKKEEEAKLQADLILKDVLRKKHDAKKWLMKLDALMKLRKARTNTAKGRGESVSEGEAAAFIDNIEKLKQLWQEKLSMYEKEEASLRLQLKKDHDKLFLENTKEEELQKSLMEWKECLFGSKLPQVDFKGDVDRFISIRSQWDQFISSEGSPLPVGWVVPTKTF